MEMKTMNADYDAYRENISITYSNVNLPSIAANESSANSKEKQKPASDQGKPLAEPKNDMGSVDSSDTYASCNTHPFQSESDLTSDIVNQSCSIVDYVLDSNIYINPLDLPPEEDSNALRGLKKSASGDTALRNLIGSPTDNSFLGLARSPDRGSRGSLNYTTVPKHRKTRFQQVGF